MISVYVLETEDKEGGDETDSDCGVIASGDDLTEFRKCFSILSDGE